MEIKELLNAIWNYENEKAKNSNDYHPKEIRMNHEYFHKLMSNPDIFKWVLPQDYPNTKFMGIPIFRTKEVKTFEII
jgi:hypothetical protein